MPHNLFFLLVVVVVVGTIGENGFFFGCDRQLNNLFSQVIVSF